MRVARGAALCLCLKMVTLVYATQSSAATHENSTQCKPWRTCFVKWYIMITRPGGWEPSWKYPLIATVVVVSIIIGVLLFILLLYM